MPLHTTIDTWSQMAEVMRDDQLREKRGALDATRRVTLEFLVRIEVGLPADMPEERRVSLLASESARGRELMEAGELKRIWRIPGRLANFSLYDVTDATVLHDLISSLPLWPWIMATVEPLAVHPLESANAAPSVVSGKD